MSLQLEFKAFLGASVGIDVRGPLVIILTKTSVSKLKSSTGNPEPSTHKSKNLNRTQNPKPHILASTLL